MKRRIVWVIVILAAYLIGRVVQSMVDVKNAETQAAAFDTALERYLDLKGLQGSSAEPYLHGKLLLIDTERRAVDQWVYPKLPKALRSRSPEEVGTVGLVTWGWEQVGVYVGDGTKEETGKAYVSTVEVALVDPATRTVIGRIFLQGEPPAGGLTRKGDYRSERPMFKLLQYLEPLPRR